MPAGSVAEGGLQGKPWDPPWEDQEESPGREKLYSLITTPTRSAHTLINGIYFHLLVFSPGLVFLLISQTCGWFSHFLLEVGISVNLSFHPLLLLCRVQPQNSDNGESGLEGCIQPPKPVGWVYEVGK